MAGLPVGPARARCSRSRPLRRLALAGIVVISVAACGSGAARNASARATLGGFTQHPAQQVGTVALPDASQAGAAFSMRAPAGGVLIVYFGYTSCPDICPTTLADLHIALRGLGREASRVEVAMVTVDPPRDTASVLTRFVQGFVPGAHALRTEDPTALQTAAHAFGAEYRVTVEPNGDESVDHTSFVYAVDQTGAVDDSWAFGTKPATITHDLRILLDRDA